MVFWTPIILGAITVAGIFFNQGYSIPFLGGPSQSSNTTSSNTTPDLGNNTATNGNLDTIGALVGMVTNLLGFLTSERFVLVLMLLLALQVISIIGSFVKK